MIKQHKYWTSVVTVIEFHFYANSSGAERIDIKHSEERNVTRIHLLYPMERAASCMTMCVCDHLITYVHKFASHHIHDHVMSKYFLPRLTITVNYLNCVNFSRLWGYGEMVHRRGDACRRTLGIG